jgi:hypothetical protein
VVIFDVLSRNMPEIFKEIPKNLLNRAYVPAKNDSTGHITKTLKSKPKR